MRRYLPTQATGLTHVSEALAVGSNLPEGHFTLRIDGFAHLRFLPRLSLLNGLERTLPSSALYR